MSTTHKKAPHRVKRNLSTNPHPANHPHQPKRHPKRNLAIAGFLLLIPPLYIQSIWIRAYNVTSNVSGGLRTKAFLRHFPEALQSLTAITIFSIACCIFSIILSSKSFNQKFLTLRLLSTLAVVIASVIILLNIFQVL